MIDRNDCRPVNVKGRERWIYVAFSVYQQRLSRADQNRYRDPLCGGLNFH